MNRKHFFKKVYGENNDSLSDIIKLFIEDYNKVKDTDMIETRKLFQKYSLAIAYKADSSMIVGGLSRFKRAIRDNGGKYEKEALDSFWWWKIYDYNNSEVLRKKELKSTV